MADLLLRLIAEDAASGAFDSVGGAAKKAAAIFYDFAKDSVKAFAEAERAQKQLARAAGENTEAFSKLAEQMSAQLAVEDEEIKKLQTLTLSYGVLPQQVEGATRAVLDYAAATGRDATGAMQQLINGVEAGNGTLGRMGVTFDATGDKAQDLQNAVDALSKKFGGAAAADADTLAGRARGAEIALGELKETLGSLFDMLEKKTGILATTTSYLRGITAAIQLASDGNFAAAGLAAFAAGQSLGGNFSIQPGAGPGVDARYAGSDPMITPATMTHLAGVGDKKKGGGKGGGSGGKGGDWSWGVWGDPASDFDLWLNDYQAAGDEKINAMNEQVLKEAALATKRFLQEEQEEEKHDEAMLSAKRKASKMQLDVMLKHTDQEALELRKRTQLWLSAGMQIGQAVLNGIFAVIEAATSGEKQDGNKVAMKVTQGIMNAIFSAFGMGWASSTMFGAINTMDSGNVAGGAAGMFGGMAAGGAQASFSAPAQHSGGWIQRFHRGGWSMRDDEQMALLQHGERVLSRREVGAMGGPSGVESAVRGGGGGRSLVIQAFDSSSILEFFGDRGGRGMLNAARTNTGPLRLMFGKAG